MTESQQMHPVQLEIIKSIKSFRIQRNLYGTIPSKHEAMILLKRMNFPPHIINHQLAVMRKALSIAHNIVHGKVDIEVIRAGALLHDIGRFVSHDLIHTSLGGDILRDLGFPETIARIAETHSMGGITAEEAIQLGLPPRNYVPSTLEEKIICLSDKYLAGTEKVSIDDRFNRWKEKHGDSDFLREQIRRVKAIEEEILHLIHD